MTEWALLVRGIVVVSTVDEVRDERANSANHSLMRPIATDGVARSVCLCVCVRNRDNHCKKAEPIEMTFGSDCPA